MYSCGKALVGDGEPVHGTKDIKLKRGSEGDEYEWHKIFTEDKSAA